MDKRLRVWLEWKRATEDEDLSLSRQYPDYCSQKHVAMAQVWRDERWNELLAEGLGLIDEGREERTQEWDLEFPKLKDKRVQGTEMGPVGGGYASSGTKIMNLALGLGEVYGSDIYIHKRGWDPFFLEVETVRQLLRFQGWVLECFHM